MWGKSRGKKEKRNLRVFSPLGFKPGMAKRFVCMSLVTGWWWLFRALC